MTTRVFRLALLATGWTIFIAAIVFPVIMAARHFVNSAATAPQEPLFSARPIMILLKTAALALAGVMGAMLASLPAAYILGRIKRPADAPIVAAIIVVPLMVPPMVLTFGWQRLLGPHTPGLEGLGPFLRCAGIWSSWAWPIPAIIIGAGWSRIGRDAYESAILEIGGFAAFRRVVMPQLRRHVAAAALILWVLFFGEYTVPHANGLVVVATDLMAAAQSLAPADVLRQSLPSLAVTVVMVLAIRFLWPAASPVQTDGGAVSNTGIPFRARAALMAVIATTIAFPIVTLAIRRTLHAELAEAFRTYAPEVAGTLTICIATGAAVMLAGVAVGAVERLSRPALIAAIVLGVIPGALVGEAVVSAYQPIRLIYDYWPVMVIGLTVRFTWIGLLAARIALRSTSTDMIAQARLDGADEWTLRLSIMLSHQWPTLLSGLFIVAAMAMAEVAVVAVVQVPAPRMVANILIEKFHRFETGMLVSMSLWMVASIVPGAILTAVAIRSRGVRCASSAPSR